MYRVEVKITMKILKGLSLKTETLIEVVDIASWSPESALVRAGSQVYYKHQIRPETRFVRVLSTKLA